ncbi:MAG TPA: FecR domain-containing protein [Hanamia sp.]
MITRYFDDTISHAELSELSEWVTNYSSEDELAELLEQSWHQHHGNSKMPEDASRNILSSILKSSVSREPEESSTRVIAIRRNVSWIKRFAVAASILIIISVGYFMFRPTASTRAVVLNTKNTKTELIMPGGSKATLTLSGGNKIILDSAGIGLLTKQGGANVVKLSNGQLQYLPGQTANQEIVYNTMSTPVGGIYEVILPDGSKVWLNSSSSVTYPTSFSGNERRVKITGEAYFEVAHDKTKPFHVSVNEMDVEVLGTHFDINSYDNEPSIKTTLLEGKVKVSKGGSEVLITPGEQVVAGKSTNELSIKKDGVNLDKVVAWKNGKFIFLDDDINDIMRQLERWYGVSVTYHKNVTTEEFDGVISRNVNISQILDMLEKSGNVKFTIQDRNILVK